MSARASACLTALVLLFVPAGCGVYTGAGTARVSDGTVSTDSVVAGARVDGSGPDARLERRSGRVRIID